VDGSLKMDPMDHAEAQVPATESARQESDSAIVQQTTKQQ